MSERSKGGQGLNRAVVSQKKKNKKQRKNKKARWNVLVDGIDVNLLKGNKIS
jgi:hypothetical protein